MGFDDEGESGREVISGGATGSSCGSLLGRHSVCVFLSDDSKQILGCKTGHTMVFVSPRNGNERSSPSSQRRGAASEQWSLKICLPVPRGNLVSRVFRYILPWNISSIWALELFRSENWLRCEVR